MNITSGYSSSITNQGVGQWWKAEFEQEYFFTKIRIQNRNGWGYRLAKTNVMVSGTLVGSLPDVTQDNEWYEIPCNHRGNEIKLVTTQDVYLQIQNIEVYTVFSEYYEKLFLDFNGNKFILEGKNFDGAKIILIRDSNGKICRINHKAEYWIGNFVSESKDLVFSFNMSQCSSCKHYEPGAFKGTNTESNSCQEIKNKPPKKNKKVILETNTAVNPSNQRVSSVLNTKIRDEMWIGWTHY